MSQSISRRDALAQLGAAGAGVVLARAVLRGQSAPITVAGRPVEIVIASVSTLTVRITVSPLDNGKTQPVPDTGALVAAANARAVGRRRDEFAPTRAGDLVVRFTPNPPTLHVATAKGEALQRLTFDTKEPTIRFSLGKGPLFGLG